jgi:hypothetical protein
VELTPVGAASATASGTAPATLTVRGDFDAGAAQITWRHDGHVIAVWVFTVELG